MKKTLVSCIIILLALVFFVSCTNIKDFIKPSSQSLSEKAATEIPILIETEWLATRNNSLNLRIIDYGRKIQEYQNGHIHNAVFVDRKTVWDKINDIPGMLPAVENIVPELEKAGISNDSLVVIYDSGDGLWASRLFWAMEYLGHNDVHILNGGWNKWAHEQRPIQMAAHTNPSGIFSPHLQNELLTSKDWIVDNLSNPDVLIIDTRSPGEYAGEDIRTARGGHIPGSVNINWISNLNKDNSKTFAPEKILSDLYQSKSVSHAKSIVTLCQTGVRATHTYFALRLLGYPRVSVYDGSWAEWGNSKSTPIIKQSPDNLN